MATLKILQLSQERYYDLRITDLPFYEHSQKSRKATISVVISVCPSVRPSVRKEQLGSH
jgi:hypothetical protein